MRKFFQWLKDRQLDFDIRAMFYRRTPEQKIQDGIAKQVGAYRHNRFKLRLSHTRRYIPVHHRTMVVDHKPEEKRLFH